MTIEQRKSRDDEQEEIEVSSLSSIEIDRIDIVSQGAIGRTFHLLKAKNPKSGEAKMLEQFTKDADGILQNLSKGSEDTITEATELVTNLKKALEDKESEIDRDKAQALVSNLEKALKNRDEVSTTLTELVTGLKGLAIEKEEDPVDSEAEKALKASELSEEVKAQLLESLKKQAEEAKEAEVIKDQAYQTRIEKAELEAASAKDEIAKMKYENQKAEWIKKAQDYTHISGSAEDIGSLLMEIEKVSKESAEKVETLLKSAEVELKESKLFKELGTSTQPNADSAEGQIQVIAKAMVEKGDITIEAALAKAWEDNPELLKEYSEEFAKKVK